MHADDFQIASARTCISRSGLNLDDRELLLIWDAIGVAGEAGEVAELAKKQIFHRHGIDREKWKKELGDVLWYVAACCTHLDLKLSEVMEANVDKLAARFPEGWDPARTTDQAKAELATVLQQLGRVPAEGGA